MTTGFRPEAGGRAERPKLSRFRLRLSFFFWAGLAVALALTIFGIHLVQDMEERYRMHVGMESELMRILDRLRLGEEGAVSSLLESTLPESILFYGGDFEQIQENMDRLMRRTEELSQALGVPASTMFRAQWASLAEQERRIFELASAGKEAEAQALLGSEPFRQARSDFTGALDAADALIAQRHAADMKTQFERGKSSLVAGAAMILLLLSLWGGVFYQYRRYLRQLSESRSELASAKAEAEGANQAKSLFLASVSHELRTPLNAVMGFSQMLQDEYYGPLNEKQAEYVNDIVQGAFQLNMLIGEVLDLARVDMSSGVLSISPVRPGDLVERTLTLARDRALQCGVQVESEVEELPTVALDRNKIRQALLSMVDNGLRLFGAGGRIVLRARRADAEEARRAGLVDGPVLLYVVEGRGGGLNSQECRDVFKPFFKLPREAADGWAGVGSGLALVRKYAELHGGAAWIESEGPGKGAGIVLALPMNGGMMPGPEENAR
ncbi:sensor histidine kinase [Paucidesulfovibrio longus]|uniref:sensor histidine kinase n=1 Tax=Paucidesulfovibrio longus TaxID=889 RepID=UPI0003B6C391|nr:histidine kinase dimerization/phospho-acceptor domain-containing protein [Paucidesulfovibrio longus]